MQAKNGRLWLCTRTETGGLKFGKNLTQLSPVGSLDLACPRRSGRESWIGLFYETPALYPRDNAPMENLWVLFLKIFIPETNNLRVLGHRIVHKDTRTLDIFSELANAMQLSRNHHFRVFKENNDMQGVQEIEPSQSLETVRPLPE